MKLFAAFLAFVLLALPAAAQIPGGVVQSGVVTAGHCASWTKTGVIQDAGSACGTAGSIIVGTTTISGGTSSYILYNNAGVLGNLQPTGSGLVVLQTSPSLITPALGVATGTSLALGGATIGTDALGITGTATISGLATAGSVIVTGAAGITVNSIGGALFMGVGSANRVALSSNTAGDITSFSGGRIGFTSTATSAAGAPDTFWSRVAAGQMGSNGSVSTAAPAGSSAGAWKLGALQTGAIVLDTTRSIFVDIGGTVYKLMVAQ